MVSDLDALPARFGRYEILGLIGSGSFADVVRAWDGSLASHVAIKVLNQTATADELIRQRFVEEGQLLRRISSDAVLAVHDIGELDDGRPYLVLELAEGGTLADRIDGLEDRPIDGATVATVVEGLASGLAAIHRAGVVHRDIKPENILIGSAEIAPARAVTGTPTVVQDRLDGPDGGDRRQPAETGVLATDGSGTMVSGGLLAAGERLLIADLGLAKDLTARGSAPSVIGGSARYQAPEQLRVDGVLGPPTDLYAASAVMWRLLTGRVAPEPHDLGTELSRLRPGWQAFFERAMATEADDRFPTVDAWRSAALDQLEAEPLALAEGGDGAATRSLACPYKGLASFQPEDAEVFFGREDLVAELVRRLSVNRVLVVAGPSGSGKSSAIRAGLLPALRAGALAGSEEWRYELFTPGADPFAELHYRLTRDLEERPRVTTSELAADPTAARRLLDQAVPGGWLLYIDQFEELFTLTRDPTVAAAFVEALAAMVDPTDSQLRLVLAVRADFYSRCAQISWLAQRITENQVLVGPMSGENMRRAIEEPARRHGLRFEAGLVDAVLDEGGREAGSLPLISHAMVETWARRDGNMLTLDGFHQAGGVAGAIAQSADAIYETTFDTDHQEAARRLLLRLVTPGEGTPDTRRRLPLTELDRDVEPDKMRDVVDELVSARLLAVDDRSVEIAHEALIGGWPRLRGWIDAERENLRFRQRVGRAAAEWETGDRDPDLLWRGTPLATALDWAAEHGPSLDRLEQDFLDRSREARDEADAARAQRVARAQRTRRLATIALVGLTLASVVASIVAFAAFTSANSSAGRAQQQFTNALGTSALGQARSDPKQALLLAMESRDNAATTPVDARAAMVQARLALAEPGVVPDGPPIGSPGAFRVALTEDGSLAAVADSAGPIRLYDTETGLQRGETLAGHVRGPRTLDFTSDGSQLLSGGADGRVLSWDLSDPDDVPDPQRVAETGFLVWSIDVHPDDRRVAVATDEATITMYDIGTGAEEGQVIWDDGTGGITVVAFSPSGDRFVASNRSGRVNGWETDSLDRLWDPASTPEGPKQWEIVFHPDGTQFAMAGDGPQAHVHDARTGQPIDGLVFGDRPEPGEGDGTGQLPTKIRGIAYSADGTRIIGGSAGGTIHVWTLSDPQRPPTGTTTGHTDAVEWGAISGDGRRYVTAGDDQRLRIWQFDPVPLSRDFGGLTDGAFGAAFEPGGQRLAVGDGAGRLNLIDLDPAGTGEIVTSADGHDGPLWDVVWSPDGSWLATIGVDGVVLSWDGTTGQPTGELGRHQGPGRSIAVSPDGRYLVTSDRGDDQGVGADVFVWDMSGPFLAHQLDQHEQGIRATAFDPDGELLATGDGAGTIRLWNVADGTKVQEWSAHPDPIWAIAFTGDGLLASVAASEDLRVFDPESGETVGITVAGLGTNGATGVGFGPDPATAAVITQAGELHMIDWEQGVSLAAGAIPAHGESGSKSWELAVEDGTGRFVTTSTDGTVRVWDLLSTDRACQEAATRLDPSIQTDLFAGTSPVACS